MAKAKAGAKAKIAAVKRDTVKIRGSGDTVEILLNGEPVQRCVGFKLVGRNPDEPTTLVLSIDAVVVDVEGDFAVEQVQAK